MVIQKGFVSLYQQGSKYLTTQQNTTTMINLENKISTLTEKQTELFLSLVKLGDSKEALKTVLDERFNPEKENDNSMYKLAYYS